MGHKKILTTLHFLSFLFKPVYMVRKIIKHIKVVYERIR